MTGTMPAFPSPQPVCWRGMDCRDYLAANAPQLPDFSTELAEKVLGLEAKTYRPELHYADFCAWWAYQYADAMLKRSQR